jgi:hypothetical protein
MNWDRLNSLQIGKYAEYLAKMEFTSYGFDVFTSEVDDKGIDFIVKTNGKIFLEIQVKSVRNWNKVFLTKDKFDINNKNLYLVFMRFENNKMPDIFIIPASAWKEPNAVFKSNDFGPGFESKPEWGLLISKKNISTLEQYKSEIIIEELL